MSEGLYVLPLSFFCEQDFNLYDGPAAPGQKCVNVWVLNLARNVYSFISTSVREYVFYVFFIFQKHDFLRFFWNDVLKRRKSH